MLREDSHPPDMKRVEYGVRQSCRAEFLPNPRVREKINRTANAEVRITAGADAVGLPLINEGDRPVHSCGNVRDGSGFTIVERQRGRTDDQLFEMQCGGIIKSDD